MTSPPDIKHRTLAEPLNRAPGQGVQKRANITTVAQRRLEDASRRPFADPVTFSESADSLSRLKGYDNPYGRGLAAYEPNTVIFDDYRTAKAATDASKASEAAKAAAANRTTEVDFRQAQAQGAAPDFSGGGQFDANGAVGRMIAAAQDLANRRVPYVWGGTGRNGVDCSGMIFYAAKAAGINMPRYRAVDYGRMGSAVNLESARAGDIVYFDNPGDVDHVGIYIGNGQMIQAPQTGDVVRVTSLGRYTSIRRVFNDDQFAAVATPQGAPAASYAGRGTPAPRTVTQVMAPTRAAPAPATVSRTRGTGGTMKRI